MHSRSGQRRHSLRNSTKGLRAFLNEPATHAVIALGITQIICWGTTIYALGVLATPITQATGWSRALVFGGLTVGLLLSGILSTSIGRMIDRHGARAVMSLGTGLLVAGLIGLALAQSPLQYLSAWALLGPGMRMTLYDAAFAALVQVTPTRGRRAISFLTLFGGFASTIFWPIGFELALQFGWRTTLLIYAALNLVVCLPLHWWGLARRDSDVAAQTMPGVAGTGPVKTIAAGADVELDVEAEAPAPAPAPSVATLLTGRDRSRAIALFAVTLAACGFIFGALAVHLVNLIASSGLAMTSAVFIASWKGVAQVAGRIWDLVFAKNLPPMTLGRVAIVLLPLAFGILILGGASFTTAMMFTLVLGAGNGLVTILRGALPLQLFGSRGYGEVLGLLATPYWLMNAVAPIILAFVIDIWGYGVAELVLLGAALLAYLSIEAMALWLRREGSAGGARSIEPPQKKPRQC